MNERTTTTKNKKKPLSNVMQCSLRRESWTSDDCMTKEKKNYVDGFLRLVHEKCENFVDAQFTLCSSIVWGWVPSKSINVETMYTMHLFLLFTSASFFRWYFTKPLFSLWWPNNFCTFHSTCRRFFISSFHFPNKHLLCFIWCGLESFLFFNFHQNLVCCFVASNAVTEKKLSLKNTEKKNPQKPSNQTLLPVSLDFGTR